MNIYKLESAHPVNNFILVNISLFSFISLLNEGAYFICLPSDIVAVVEILHLQKFLILIIK